MDLTCNAPSPPKNKTIPCGWSCFLHRKDLNASARERERCERRRWRMKRAKASDKTRSIATAGARRLCFGGAKPYEVWRENLSISAIQVHNSDVVDLFFFESTACFLETNHIFKNTKTGLFLPASKLNKPVFSSISIKNEHCSSTVYRYPLKYLLGGTPVWRRKKSVR